DAFYIGGTKQGILFGEALVILNDALKKDFRYVIKQNGGMLAKGRLLGVQFCALMEDDLYFELSRHAVGLAMQLKQAMLDMGVEFLVDSPSNQQFPILDDTVIEALEKNYSFSYQERVDEKRSAVRFCTSWASRQDQVDALIADLKKLMA
ncbi:MAG: low specificity L-threonine aldolase, partial [Clostridia bacterium]|nr:low specificity L-threonine aldolase [Clostridia bacterium]